MLFEYDPEKSRLNKQKHGIDFEEAKSLWEDDEGVQVPAREKYIRIISVRTARQEERNLYGKEI